MLAINDGIYPNLKNADLGEHPKRDLEKKTTQSPQYHLPVGNRTAGKHVIAF